MGGVSLDLAHHHIDPDPGVYIQQEMHMIWHHFHLNDGIAWSIHNLNNGTTLVAESVTTLAENGSTNNYGLSNYDGTATADGSQFTGVSNGLALGNFGLYLNGGTVSLGVSQLDGYAYRTSGTLTCFQVYDGNYAAYTCP